MKVTPFVFKEFKDYKYKPGSLNINLLYLLESERFVSDINNEFSNLNVGNNTIINMLDCIIKICENLISIKYNNEDIRFLYAIQWFNMGIQTILKNIKSDKHLSTIFFKFDDFIRDNIENFIKFLSCREAHGKTRPSNISSYFYRNLIFDDNINVDYNIILSLLVGDDILLPNNNLYSICTSKNIFVPLFYCIIKTYNK